MFRPYLIRRRWDPDASLVLDYFRTNGYPASNDYARIVNLTTLIRKNIGEQQRDYVFYHFAAPEEAQAIVNWKAPGTFTLSKAGTVSHVANRGFTPAGTTADGLTSTFNPSTAGIGTDDVAVEIYSRTNQAASSRYDWGGTASALAGRTRISSDTGSFRLNMSAAVALPPGIATTAGLQSWLRGAANTAQFCQNGVQIDGDIAVTSQAAPNVTMNWGNGVIGTFTSATKELAYGRVCRAMTVARCLEHYQGAILPLLQWNGANI